MSESPYSPLWYRCARLKPRLRSHARILRHEYRDQIWYVLQDPSSGRHHRFTPAVYQVIGAMDGSRTLESLWQRAVEALGDEAPTQGEMIHLLGQLHGADVLQTDVPPDLAEMFERYRKQRRTRWKQKMSNPLAVRLPLFDPERFLERATPWVRPLFTWPGFAMWFAVVVLGAVLAASNWNALTEDLVARVLTVQNVFLLIVAYPAVKALHELGHAFATKVWGGEVHDIGIMFLVFMPVPYVEASSASGFPGKYHRMVVGGIGVMVELFLAALALLVWLVVEPGLVSALAYNVMLIGGVSTLFFNGNPLLRFDGYYVLADALEIPNLAGRSRQYLAYLARRYLLGMESVQSPAGAPGERGWFVAYGVASFVYRMFIMFFIVIFVAGKFFFVGLVLAIWAITNQIVLPLAKMGSFVLTGNALRRQRAGAVLKSIAVLAGIAAVLFLLPAPHWTRAEGVVWLPERSQVRASVDGQMLRLLAEPGARVRRGDPLIETGDFFLRARVAEIEGQLAELDARLVEIQFIDLNRAEVVRHEIAAVSAALARARVQAAELVIQSPADGIFVLADSRDLTGRFVRRGDVLAYINDRTAAIVRVVVPQASIGLVREHTRAIEAVLADWHAEPFTATVKRVVPAAQDRLPTLALGTEGGGPFPVDPRDPSGLRTLEKVFQLDLVLPEEVRAPHIGARVFVRFDHGTEPAGLQWYQSLRRLLLRQFGV